MTSHDDLASPESSPAISLLVPVKDEVDSLPQLVKEIDEAMSEFAWELIIVDDGSADGSWDVICDLAAERERVRGIRMRRNFGKSAALSAGFEESIGDIIVTLDGDLQDDPAEIPRMISRLGPQADVVAGHKAERKDPWGKRLPSKVFNFFTGVMTGLKLRDHNCGLKVSRREAFASVPLYGEMHRYFAAISYAQGFAVFEEPVHHRPREHGSSKFGLERYTRGALDLLTVVSLTRYNHRPAHLLGGLGLVMGIAGVALLTYLTVLWIATDTAIGQRPLLLLGVLLVVVSVQMVSLGLVAELMINRHAVRDNPGQHVSEQTPVPT